MPSDSESNSVVLAPPSWPGSSRPSTPLAPRVKDDVDARDKPGHDEIVVTIHAL
jgi:hypothetical protein